MTAEDGGPTLRESFFAAYRQPLTWIGLAAAFFVWVEWSYLGGLAVALVVCGFSASRAIDELLD